jgi:hypothetical protein
LQRAKELIRRRATVLAVIVGAAIGVAPGAALAISGSFNHTYALWNHGFDGNHVYMSSTDGAGRNGGVAGYYCSYLGSSCNLQNWHDDIASHIHNDYNSGISGCYAGGGYRSSQTGLSTHVHSSSC